MLCLLVLLTHVAPYLATAIYLSCLSLKQKSTTFFITRFNLSCGMFVYRFDKSKFETEEVLFVLFSLLIGVITAFNFRKKESMISSNLLTQYFRSRSNSLRKWLHGKVSSSNNKID